MAILVKLLRMDSEAMVAWSNGWLDREAALGSEERGASLISLGRGRGYFDWFGVSFVTFASDFLRFNGLPALPPAAVRRSPLM